MQQLSCNNYKVTQRISWQVFKQLLPEFAWNLAKFPIQTKALKYIGFGGLCIINLRF
jgi:hypothetical protein